MIETPKLATIRGKIKAHWMPGMNVDLLVGGFVEIGLKESDARLWYDQARVTQLKSGAERPKRLRDGKFLHLGLVLKT